MVGLRTVLFLLLLFLGLAPGMCAKPSAAPVFDASGIGDQIKLDRGWLFHVGYDPGFAAPGLDDGRGRASTCTRRWLTVGFRQVRGSGGFGCMSICRQ